MRDRAAALRAPAHDPVVRTGLERLVAGEGPDLRDARLGLVLDDASVTCELERADRALMRHTSLDIAALFGRPAATPGDELPPEAARTLHLGLAPEPSVHSMYGDVRTLDREALRGLDVVVFDIQDVGARAHPTVSALALAMEACREAGVPLIVLDRPNPIGGIAREGPLLDPRFASAVALHPMPLRHGLSLGELARLFRTTFGLGAELDVVACDGWHRAAWLDAAGLPFVMPAPSLPALDSCALYPGMVLLEGTNLSEGRGTTRPFELFGAPYLAPDVLVARLDAAGCPGVHFRPCHFVPSHHKHAGELCGGAQIHVRDRDALRPIALAVTILRAVADLAPRSFAWSAPPYADEAELLPIDMLWGSAGLREGIEGGGTPDEILDALALPLAGFAERAGPALLYLT